MFYITAETDWIDDKIVSASAYFDMYYEVDWLNNQLAKDIIKGIDNSDHILDHLIVSPIFGGISPRDLSGGCKGVLLLMNMPNIIVRGECFGDNCLYWLGKVGEMKDIHISLHHYIDDLTIPVTACFTNNGKVVHNSYDLAKEYYYLVSGE